MNCRDFRDDLSAFADESLDASRAARVREHLRECTGCTASVVELGRLRRVVRAAGRLVPPAELALALRVRLSQAAHSNLLERLKVRFENFLEPLAVPATAGLFSAILMFGIIIHSLAIHTPAQTEADEIRLLVNTKPRLVAMPPLGFHTEDQGLSVEVRIDSGGRIVDFRLLNGPHDPVMVAQLRRVLLFTQFDPATSFGFPRHGTAVFNFRSILVKG